MSGAALDEAIRQFKEQGTQAALERVLIEVERTEEQARMRALELDIKLAVLKYLGKV